MWIHLSIIALFIVEGQAKDAAVLIGGYIMEDFNHDLSVDVYTNHLGDAEKVCQQTGSPPTVPNLPFGTSGHSGVFLPDSGIHICGWFGNLTQQSSGCWKYDARISKEWIEIDVETDGIQHAAIIEGTSSMLSDSNSFWMMGGLNYENQVLEETKYLDVSSSSNGFQPGINLPKHIYGHCAINTKIPLTGSDVFEAAIIMGGYEGDDRINVKSSNKAYAFCQADEQIDAAVCNDTKIGNYDWGSFPDMKSSLYGFKGFGHTYCTQFNNEDLCDGICLMATGSFAKMSEYFPLSRCAKTGNDCEWIDSIGGNPLNITRLNFQHGIGGMTNLDNVPVLFLPMHDGSGNQWMEVLEFQHEDEIGNSVDQWVSKEVLSSHRESFNTLSVPIEFLCSEPDSTSSTYKTTKPQTQSTQPSTPKNNGFRIFSRLSTFISVIHAFLLICSYSI